MTAPTIDLSSGPRTIDVPDGLILDLLGPEAIRPEVLRPAVLPEPPVVVVDPPDEAVVTPHDAPAPQIGPIERTLAFAFPFLLFLTAGWNQAVVHQVLPGDALARVHQAASTIFSRDPHLEAIGFVWAPFPTLFEIPVVWLGRWFPVLLTRGVASIIVSSILMALMISVTYRWLAECGLRRASRAAMCTVLALHPMILLHGANGLSDACMLCFLVIGARRLALWWERETTLDLVAAGVAIAFAYLTRYEVAASIVFVVVAVVYKRWRSSTEVDRDQRVRESAAAGLVVGLPPMFAFGAWALASWAIVGQPFAQFTSEYGNSTQFTKSTKFILQIAGALAGPRRGIFFGQQLLVLGSLAFAAMGLFFWFGTRGGARVAAACAALGGPLAFHFMSSIAGATFPWARYSIAVVPLGVLLTGPVLASVVADRRRSAAVRRVAPLAAAALGAAAVVLSIVPLKTAGSGTKEETWQFTAYPWPYHTTEFADRMSWTVFGEKIARDLDELSLQHGDVITDTAASFPVVLNAADPRDYIIPSDRDFLQAASAPADFGVRYVLVGNPEGNGFDAVAAANPGLFANGAGIGRLIKEWGSKDDPGFNFRLYEVDNPRPKR